MMVTQSQVKTRNQQNEFKISVNTKKYLSMKMDCLYSFTLQYMTIIICVKPMEAKIAMILVEKVRYGLLVIMIRQ